MNLNILHACPSSLLRLLFYPFIAIWDLRAPRKSARNNSAQNDTVSGQHLLVAGAWGMVRRVCAALQKSPTLTSKKKIPPQKSWSEPRVIALSVLQTGMNGDNFAAEHCFRETEISILLWPLAVHKWGWSELSHTNYHLREANIKAPMHNFPSVSPSTLPFPLSPSLSLSLSALHKISS